MARAKCWIARAFGAYQEYHCGVASVVGDIAQKLKSTEQGQCRSKVQILWPFVKERKMGGIKAAEEALQLYGVLEQKHGEVEVGQRCVWSVDGPRWFKRPWRHWLLLQRRTSVMFWGQTGVEGQVPLGKQTCEKSPFLIGKASVNICEFEDFPSLITRVADFFIFL